MIHTIDQQRDSGNITDQPRRRFLITTTAVLATAGVVTISVPFIKSWLPSERAKVGGAPIQFDLSKLEPGRQVTLEWRSKPVFILHRTPEILQAMNRSSHLQQLRDPDSEVDTQQPIYAANPYRAIKEGYFIVIAICTHLGCIPTFRPEVKPEDLGAEWIGGYFCPCHSSKFDLAGRVFQGVPAPTNLVVPPYRYLSDTVIEIGVNPEGETDT